MAVAKLKIDCSRSRPAPAPETTRGNITIETATWLKWSARSERSMSTLSRAQVMSCGKGSCEAAGGGAAAACKKGQQNITLTSRHRDRLEEEEEEDATD
eukprot:4942265-Pyramimonas_sp.AAC.1